MKRVMLVLAACLLLASCGWTDPKDDGGSPALPSTTTSTSLGDDATDPGDGEAAAEGTGGRPCTPGDFPTWLRGRPDALADATSDGVYVFSDRYGIHVRVKGAVEPAAVVDIVVTTDVPITILNRRPDTLPADGDANRYEAALQATPDGQGFDIDPCKVSRFSVSVKANGQPWPAEALFVGRSGTAFGNPVDAAKA